jgi:hypothetical protein
MTKTAERINSMTPMEILEFVETAIIAQGKASVYDHDGKLACAYRGKDGTSKCAMGLVIDDADYIPSFEGMRAWDVTERLGIVDTTKRNLLSRLQYAHDNAHRDATNEYDVCFVDSFKSKMVHVRNWLTDGGRINDLRGYREFE